MRIVVPIVVLALVLALPAGAADSPSLEDVADGWSVTLTTTGRSSGLPRTVTIWFVVEDDRVYVQSGKGGDTDWYRNLLTNPEVTLGFGELSFRGRARPVEDAALTETIHEKFRQKYLMARLSGWVGGEMGRGEVVAIDRIE